MRPGPAGHAAMMGFACLVGGSFSLGTRIANDIEPAALNAIRFFIAALVIGGWALATTGLPRSALRQSWRYVLLGGIFGIYFVLMFEGLKTASSVSAAAVFTLTPIMAAGFGWLLLRQRLTPRMALALTIGGGGALWVIFRGQLSALLALEIGRGEAIYLAGCVFHALYTPMVRKLNRGEPAVVFSLGVLVAGGILLSLYGRAEIAATDWAGLGVRVWSMLLYIAVFATAVSFVLLQFAALRIPAAKVMAYTYLVPSWVIVWEVALGGALPGAIVLVGVGLSVAALLLLLRDEEAP